METSRISVIKITVAVLVCATVGFKVLEHISSSLQAQTTYDDGLYQQQNAHAGLLARLRESAREQH